jgi:hypothetical protein
MRVSSVSRVTRALVLRFSRMETVPGKASGRAWSGEITV